MMGSGCREGSLVTRISMTCDADSGIVGKDTLESLTHFRSAVGYDHLTGMKRIADAHSAAMME